MSRNVWNIAAAVLLCLGLSSRIHADAPDELDKIKWLDHTAWDCAKTVVVRAFPVTGKFKGIGTREEYADLFAKRLVGGLRGVKGLESVEVSNAPELSASDVVCDGEFTELTTGSRAVRFWVSFGAGKAKCEVKMRCYRPSDNTRIVELRHGRISPMGLKKDEIEENLVEVADDVADVLLQARGVCKDSPRAAVARASSTNGVAMVVVDIASEPSGGEVYVDGDFVGNAPLNYRLIPGKHSLEVKKKGYLGWKRDLLVSADVPTKVMASLELEVSPPR